jgi:pyridoxamine 5'-phosphate oxidase family protein
MSVFTPAEIEYLQSQRLARLATADDKGQPHVVPVSFRYNPELDTIDIGGGLGFTTRKKWRDVHKNPRIAIVMDDVPQPGQVRGIEIRGEAEVLMDGGKTISPNFDPEMFRLKPKHVVSWGIDTGSFERANSRDVNAD